MNRILLTGILVISAASCMPARDHPAQIIDAGKETDEQAKYAPPRNHFDDLFNQKLEVRNGINLKGMYSYSDGHFRRTIRYVADDKGYRVIQDDIVPLPGTQVVLNPAPSSSHAPYVKYVISDEDESETPETPISEEF